jgi:hypothetical protein
LHLYRTSMGDLVSASFPIPDNPILLGVAQKQGVGSIGDMVAAAFPLPQNPITAATSLDRPKVLTPPDTRNALMRSLTAAKTGPVAMQKGMGDAASTLQSVGAVLDNTISVGGTDIPYWVLGIGAAAVLMYMMGGKQGPNRYQRFKTAH